MAQVPRREATTGESSLASSRAHLVRAFRAAQAKGDTAALVEAALLLPSVQRFGAAAGQLPALLHEAYMAAPTPETRARLAAALARAWVYAGDAERAKAFAHEAEQLARQAPQPAVLAEAIDAALAASWGPDDFETRRGLAARLSGAVAHLTDERMRLAAHLWRLTTAWECLDTVAVQRQLRELDLLAEETGSTRVAMFAASRRAMYCLVRGDLGAAGELIERTRNACAALTEPDAEAVLHSLTADLAKQTSDRETLAQEAAAFETYGVAEGIPSVLSEAGVLWLLAGNTAAAERVARQVAAGGLNRVPRDVDFLLTICGVVAVGAALELDDLAGEGGALLEPYAGRAVLNAGAVTFHGVVDDYLYRVHRGTPSADRWRHAAIVSYRRLGASWWERTMGDQGQRGLAEAASVERPTVAIHLHPGPRGAWLVGCEAKLVLLPDLKGLHYLRWLVQRPGVEVGAVDLSTALTGNSAPHSDAGLMIDRTALAEYRGRLAELDEELGEAQSFADSARVERLKCEREAILHEIRAATGLGGRPRRSGATNERARVAVRKAIAAAIRRIAHEAPELGRLLRDTVRTGQACCFEPDPGRPIHWIVDQH